MVVLITDLCGLQSTPSSIGSVLCCQTKFLNGCFVIMTHNTLTAVSATARAITETVQAIPLQEEIVQEKGRLAIGRQACISHVHQVQSQ